MAFPAALSLCNGDDVAPVRDVHRARKHFGVWRPGGSLVREVFRRGMAAGVSRVVDRAISRTFRPV